MVNIDYMDLLKQFFIGGLLVATITFLGNNVSVELAAIVTALPIGLIPIYYFNKKTIAQNFGLDATLTNLIVFFTYLVYDYFIRRQQQSHISLLYAFLAWGAFSTVLFVYWKYFKWFITLPTLKNFYLYIYYKWILVLTCVKSLYVL